MREFIIRYWVEAAFGIVISILGYRFKKIKSHVKYTSDEYDALKNGMLSLLRAELIRSGEKYLKQKWIEVYAKDAYDKAYTAYHELGGNGTMTELHEKIMDLSTIKPTNKRSVTYEKI